MRTRLHSDDPTPDPTRGHRRLAEALIETVQEGGGGTIAVLGPFGSGKSTVLQSALGRLEPQAEELRSRVHSLVFDAWAHRGAPLRRSLLEAFAHTAQSSGIPEAEAVAGGVLKELQTRRTTTTTSRGSGLTPLGLVGAALVLLAPLAFAFIEPLAEKTLYKRNVDGAWFAAESIAIYSHVAITVVLIAGAIFGGAAFVRAKRERERRERMKAELQAGKLDQSTGPTLIPLFERGEEVQTTTVARDPEHSSVEFERLFRSLALALLGDGTAQLVIALDDLDRIDGEEEQEAWALLRLIQGTAMGQSWRSRFWLLVPVDPTRLPPDVKRTASGVPPSDILQKVFDVRFYVPPLVASRHEEVLSEALSWAFCGIKGRTLTRVVEVFSYLHRVAPTPRQAKRFANDLVASFRQHGEDATLPAQAAFLLLTQGHTGPFGSGARLDPLSLNKHEITSLERVLSESKWLDTAAVLTYGEEKRLQFRRIWQSWWRTPYECGRAVGQSCSSTLTSQLKS